MKHFISIAACVFVCVVMLQYRYSYSGMSTGKPPLKITEWDALGYYLYLPSTIIYHDYKKLEWLPEVDRKYAVSGGDGFQAIKLDNGDYTFKYLGGVAVMELPFFLVGHLVAKQAGYPADGFSAPYQYAISLGCILYCFFGLLLLRGILLRYFKDLTVAITIAATCLATNFIEYAAIENGQSHAWIFPLYVVILYATIKWHERPQIKWASLIGFIIGLATICRPTEAIMLFIPLFWNTQSKETAKAKWQMIKQNRAHLLCAALFGLAGILPQLVYWKLSTGSFIYDVGSAWDFLKPHFRVLFGWEKGWFIYTPITVFFIAGMFFIKKFPFRKSVLWFCLLNIYIIIAWKEWRYGGSYSTRALMQSYPVFSLALAAFIEQISLTKWRWLFYALVGYLVFVNLFQITQYQKTILHYDDMNRHYYGRIYLNFHPAPLDMSFLDSNQIPGNESACNKKTLAAFDSVIPLQFQASASGLLYQNNISLTGTKEGWLKIESEINAPGCLWQSYLNAELKKGDSVVHKRVRLFSPISIDGQTNKYAFYMRVPEYFKASSFKLYITSPFTFNGAVRKITVIEYCR